MERTSPQVHRIITLSSGLSRGSNLLAIHRYFQKENLPIQIAYAVFTNSQAQAIANANAEGISSLVIPIRDPQLFEERVLSLIKTQDISLVALCGFMKKVSADFIRKAGVPILNIHPALLPKFGGKGMYGTAVHEAVFKAGEKLSGATVHLVDEEYDRGAIIRQESIDIGFCSSPEMIASAVLEIEHKIYGPSIRQILLSR